MSTPPHLLCLALALVAATASTAAARGRIPPILGWAAMSLGTGALAQEKPKATPPHAEQRADSLEPKPVEPPAPGRPKFEASPLRDGAIVVIAIGFAGVLDLINSTGEIHPQQITRNFDTDNLLWLDRGAVHQTVSSSASLYSNVGLWMALGMAIADPIATGFREHHKQAALVDFIIYAESLTLTWAVTNLAKIAVRRPRPIAYMEAEEHQDDPDFMSNETDKALSFFSGHTAICAASTATGTYLAFVRAGGGARPWITLAAGVLVTSFVGYERVRSGAHFPSDVIAGALAGGGVGVLVAHFHRGESDRQRPVWIGFTPAPHGHEGGIVTLGGRF